MMKGKNELLTSPRILQNVLDDYRKYIDIPLTNSKDGKIKNLENEKENIYKLYERLKEVFICGHENLAWYLAQFYYNGWLLDKPDPIKGDFLIALGEKLGSKKCDNTKCRDENILLPYIQKFVSDYAKFIKESNEEKKEKSISIFNKIFESGNLEGTNCKKIIEEVEKTFHEVQDDGNLKAENVINSESSSSTILSDTQQPNVNENNNSSTLTSSGSLSTSNTQQSDFTNNEKKSVNEFNLPTEQEKTEAISCNSNSSSGSTISYIVPQISSNVGEQTDSTQISGETSKNQGCYCDIL